MSYQASVYDAVINAGRIIKETGADAVKLEGGIEVSWAFELGVRGMPMPKFAVSGKRVRKKDLGRMAMTYGHVYVAQVAMKADKNQLFKALAKTEAHKGPSLVITYAPYINHGILAMAG